MKIVGKEIIAAEGKYVARKGSDIYFTRGTLLEGETLESFIEVDNLPETTELEEAKKAKIEEIESYDISDNVNSFTYKGIKMWFSKADRIGLKNSMSIEKANGKTTSTMWFNDMPLEINIDKGLALLDKIEMYALDCYNVTAKHKADVNKLNTIEEIESYKIDKDYPNKLTIN